MIHKASFRNFRGFERLELSDLQNITLISGRNNSGKSSVLEGIFLALAYKTPDSFALLNNIRGIFYTIKPEDLWDTLFYNLANTEISLTLCIDNSELQLRYARDDAFITSAAMNNALLRQFISSMPQSYSLKFSLQYGNSSDNGHFVMNQQGIQRHSEQDSNPNISLPFVQYIHSSRTANNAFLAEVFSVVTRNNKKDKLIEFLQLIDSSITDITTLVSNNIPQLYIQVNGKWLPSRLAGDGFDHMLMLTASMMAQPNSILLVDEIETGFHYSVYPKLWDAVMLTAKEEHCQVIATTHSYECLASAATQADANGMQNDFCYFRLGKNKLGQPAAFRFSQDTLAFAVNDNMEVR